MVKAVDIVGRCPSTCSGTPAATPGSWAGATDTENQILQFLKEYDAKKVIKYLKSIAKDPEGSLKIRPYFPDGPRCEKVP